MDSLPVTPILRPPQIQPRVLPDPLSVSSNPPTPLSIVLYFPSPSVTLFGWPCLFPLEALTDSLLFTEFYVSFMSLEDFSSATITIRFLWGVANPHLAEEQSEAQRGKALCPTAKEQRAAWVDPETITIASAGFPPAQPHLPWPELHRGVTGRLPPGPTGKLSDTNDQRSWAVGEASGKSQKTAKDSELETEFLIINKRQDRALHMETSGCLQPAWGAQEATRPRPTGFSGHPPNGRWDGVLGDDLQTPEGRNSEYSGMIFFSYK